MSRIKEENLQKETLDAKEKPMPKGTNQPSENKESLKKAPEEKSKGALSKTYLLFIAALACLALFVAIAAFYQLSTLRQKQSLQSVQNSRLNANLARLKKEQNQAERSLELVQKNQEGLRHANDNLKNFLKNQSLQKEDWLLLKAKHYLELAETNLYWGDAPQVAMALLQQADKSLANSNDPKILAVRESIAENLSSLKAMALPDTNGLLSELNALKTLLTQMPLAKSKTDEQEASMAQNTGAASEGPSSSSWRTQLNDSLQTLKSLVVIKHYDKDINPQISQLQGALTRESIRIHLDAAMLAVLQKNEKLFQHSLANALKEAQVLLASNGQTEGFLEQLTALQQRNLTSNKPSLAGSLQLLESIIEEKTATGFEQKPDNKEGEAP